ncbi:hypothetical protein P3X46_031241 [Hevea brasiliensis]|uniref:RING-type E3 ubiquitin transferase n=1 Tax=Hevea brasiliensis TaxID=3981 RepID=A0ABQ9KKG0_HEVBR|nr:E3 ubiquitin-protein ligase CIP8-like [Hevea brasiliensis]KAJ9140613.1 hypothetical protein P3X46_031241 [Hevea brasiliensis]
MALHIEDYEINCDVIPLHHIVEPQNASFSSNMFSITVNATFMPHFDSAMVEEEDDYDESNLILLCAESEWDTTQRTFLVERDRFLQPETSRSTVRQILLDMNVPIQEFLIEQIVDDVRQFGSDHDENNVSPHKVLHLEVNIEVPPIIFEVASDDDPADSSLLVPATKSSIEALEIVKVDGPRNQQCTICLEEILIGSEAVRMPCSHLYHHRCICTWLERSRVCPLCRFEIA